MLRRIINKIKRKLGLLHYPSETSKVRHLIINYCRGEGCDIGFGGDKIKDDAVGIDFKVPYAQTGSDKVDIACDVINEEIPIPNDVFDYVYSSHLIEDFESTVDGIKKFTKILKNEGFLILVFPDQKKYEETCKKTGQPLNQYHKHTGMGKTFMLDVFNTIQEIDFNIEFVSDCEIDYNVIIVAKIIKYGKN